MNALFRAVLVLVLALASSARSAPNVIVIFVDDLGWPDGGALWSQHITSVGLQVTPTTDILTPNLDQIAAHGVRCTNGYVSCPVCSPSRAGLMTGRHPQRFGYEMNPGPELEYDPVFGLPLTESTIGDRMKALGYATAWIGKSHLGALPHLHPVQRGFDEFYGFLEGHHDYKNLDYPFPVAPWEMPVPPWEMTDEQLTQAGLTDRGLWDPIQRATAPYSPTNVPVVVDEQAYLTTAFGREVVSYIDRHRTAHPETPFFIYAPFNAVHEPVQVLDRHLTATASLFPGTQGSARHKLAAMLYGIDEAVGAILTKLRSYDLGGGRTLENDTIIIYSSDNGAPPSGRDDFNGSVSLPLRGNKSELYEGGVRVPYIVQWLDQLTPGNYHQPVSTMDILPTCVSAAGGVVPAAWQLDGVNLLPYLKGTNPNPPHPQMFWRVETGRADEMEPGPRAMRQGKWKLIKPDWAKAWELYDLTTENGLRETENQAAARPDILQQMLPLYAEWEATLPRPRWDYRDPDYVTPTFVMNDVRVGAPGASIIAPEFLGNQCAWQDVAGALWLTPLDLGTGFPSGVPVQVTAGLSAPSAQNEGVQWGISAAGPALYYTKTGSGGRQQLWRGLTPLTTSTTLDSIGARVSQNAAATAAGLIFQRGASTVAASDAAPGTAITLPDPAAAAARNGRWIPDSSELVYVRTTAAPQLARFNPQTNTTVMLTDDGGDKTDAFAFRAPEFGYELCYACLVNHAGLAIYRDLKRGGGLYDRVATLTVPATETARFLFDMKPLAGLRGFNGVSWFSCVAYQNKDAPETGASAVWLLGLGTAPAYRLPMPPPESGHNDLCDEWKPLALRLSDPALPGLASAPETVIGTTEVFCYYSRQETGGPVQLRLTRTGLMKPAAPASGFASLDYSSDYTPGYSDPLLQRMGGTETTALVAHGGKLFAATSSHGDSSTSSPGTFTGVQMMVKDSATADWKLDTAGDLTAMFADHLAADVLTELTFTRNQATPIPAATHLVAGLRDLETNIPGSHIASARVRVGTNDWRHSTVTITPGTADPVQVMSFAVHLDGNEEFVFAGLSNGEVHRGTYDPNNPDRLSWQGADLAQNPAAKLGPVTALTEANGRLFAACGMRQDTPAGMVAGGLYIRSDANDAWVKIYEWPTPLPVYSAPESQRVISSLTAVPDPRGCLHQVLLAARWPGVVEVIDPQRSDPVRFGAQVPAMVELDVRDFFARLWNDDSVRSQAVQAGYTPLTAVNDPVTGQQVHLLGVWFSSRPGTHFLVRHRDGTWEPASIPGAGRRAVRCFAASPFAGEASLYIGGYDAGGTAAHDTAWVMRGKWEAWPELTIAPDELGFALEWPATSLEWTLESSGDLNTWAPVADKPSRSLQSTTLSLPAGSRSFFRLRGPE